MSDYQFKCGDCGKFNVINSTGSVPEYGDKVECISCGRVSEVTSNFFTLDVVKTKEIKKPSELDKLNKMKDAKEGEKE